MNKQLFIILLSLTCWAMTGCTSKNTPSIGTATLDLTVLHEDWLYDESTNQFFYHFELPEVTSSVYNFGNWTMCREFNPGTKDAYQVALPMSVYCTDTMPDNSVVYYSEYLDYRIGIGWAEVQMTISDYVYPKDEKGNLINPNNMLFRLQLIY